MTVICTICSSLDTDCEIVNSEYDDASQTFPQAYQNLVPLNADLANFYQHRTLRLYQCPECQNFFQYRSWTPGGSEDVLKTYYYESYTKISFLAAHGQLHQDWALAKNAAETPSAMQEYYQKDYLRYKIGFQEALDALHKHDVV